MGKKNPSPQTSIDIPPVPQATRFMSQEEVQRSSHFDHWITDLIGFDYQEVPLPSQDHGQARFFKIPSKRLAFHLVDTLYLPTINRNSALTLTRLDDGIYFTLHLAIASPDTIKTGIASLRQAELMEDRDNSPSGLISLFLKLQSPGNILECYRYEHFILNEILSGSPWGRTLFGALLAEISATEDELLDWQRKLLPLASTPKHSKGAALVFISLFASKELKNSIAFLASYSERVIPAGTKIPIEHRTSWSESVMSEWIDILIRETGSIPVNTPDEVVQAAQWLVEVLESVDEIDKEVAA